MRAIAKKLLAGPRFVFKVEPQNFSEDSITIENAKRIVLSNAVHARGWAFPFADTSATYTGPRESYFAGEFDAETFVNHVEEWRLYRSGQFIYRMRPWEVLDSAWQARISDSMKQRFSLVKPPSGFLSFELMIYTITEAYIFAARLTQAIPYDCPIEINAGYRSVDNFALASNQPSRPLHGPYVARIDAPEFKVTIGVTDLIADPKRYAAEAILSLFRQFNWTLPPTLETIAQRQTEFPRWRVTL